MGLEQRFYQFKRVEAQDGDGAEAATPLIFGYAAVFNVLSEELFGIFRETIMPGAFDGCLVDCDIRALWNHNPDFPLGRTTNDTLRLEQDNTGLRIEIEPPETQIGRDAVKSIQRGDVDQMSFAFEVIEDEWSEGPDGVVRTLHAVKLFEVSPVVFPAYPQTNVGVGVRGLDWGVMPDIPAEFRRASGLAVGRNAQGWIALQRKRLELLSRQ
ncbi:MAG: HK97 family phage prohead protease [Caldilineaceae bacterium]